MSPRNPRAIFRKNTPSETAANWQYCRAKIGSLVRFAFIVIAAALFGLLSIAEYAKGYFDGRAAAQKSAKESKNVC